MSNDLSLFYQLAKDTSEKARQLLGRQTASSHFKSFDFRRRKGGILLTLSDEEFRKDNPKYVPELELFLEFVQDAKSRTNKLDTFAFLDYHLPPSFYNALYVSLHNKAGIGFKRYADRLDTLYRNERVEKIVFDSNKVMQLMGLYAPFIISCPRNGQSHQPGIDSNSHEYYISLEGFSQLCEKNTLSGLSNAAEGAEYVEALLKLYEKFKSNCPDIVGRFSRKSSDLMHSALQSMKSNAQQTVGNIEYENIPAAFLTYLAFVLTITPQTWVEYIYYPYCTVKRPSNKWEWVGGILIPYTKPTTVAERVAYQAVSGNIVSTFYLGYTHALLNEQFLRSSSAAIIARNMSHTIGSHSLSYLSQSDYLTNYSDPQKAAFYRYLQNRMDYVAEVSTIEPRWSSTVRLRDDLIAEFIDQFLFLDNINRSIYTKVGNEQKELRADKYEFIVVLRDDSDKKQYRFGYANGAMYTDVFRSNSSNNWGQPDLGDFVYDILADLPHATVGKQAFFSFLENFIRNSAKHGGAEIESILKDSNKRLTITIEIDARTDNREFPVDLIRIRVSDNLQNFDNSAYQAVTKYVSGEEKEFTDDTGRLRGGAWGIYEMRIAAAWLRGANTMEASGNLREPPILRLLDPNLTKNITYEFFLQRPFELLIVGENAGFKEEPQAGIYCANSLDAVDELFQQGKLRHKMVVVQVQNDDLEWFKKAENLIKLPGKTLVVAGNENIDLDDLVHRYPVVCGNLSELTNQQAIKGWVYEKYVKWLWDTRMENELPKLKIRWTPLNNTQYSLGPNDSQLEGSILFDHDAYSRTIQQGIRNLHLLYFQPFSSSVPENFVGRLLSQYTEFKDPTIILQLYEVALTRITVADERLYKKSQQIKIRSLEGVTLGGDYHPLCSVWSDWLGVEIVDIKRQDNGFVVYLPDGSQKGLEEWLNVKNDYSTTYLLLHQGIVDEVLKEDFRNGRTAGLFKQKFRNTIIHTGRSEIKIEPGYKFLELSNLEEHIIEKPGKLRLVSLLSRIVGGRSTNA